MKMRILFASYEAAPFYKVGGLGDVAGSLPLALSKLGIATTLVLPGYQDLRRVSAAKPMGSFRVVFDHKEETVHVLKLDYAERVSVYILQHQFLSETRSSDEIFNFVFFSKAIAVLISLSKVYGEYDVVHLNDWHTATVAYFLSLMDQSRPPTILTIHNLMYQGLISRDKLANLVSYQINDAGYQSLLELGIQFADFVTTVSPTYAKEIIKTSLGLNLRKLLVEKRNRIEGILNGIDYQIWNPKTDTRIESKYGETDFKEGKMRNKLALQKELNLYNNPLAIMISFVGRLEPRQKGIDLIFKFLTNSTHMDNLQFVILGSGNRIWVKRISELARKHARKIVFVHRFDGVLAHKLYASSDIVLVPSRYEPCGLVQMIAMKYGALPLVRATGGLLDTVQNGVNGFAFKSYDWTSLANTIRRAVDQFTSQPEKVTEMQNKALREDFSWDKSAGEYKKLYMRVIHEKI